MLLKNNCQSCGCHLEFEAADVGATIDCPHCQAPTLLRAPFRTHSALRNPNSAIKSGWLITGLCLALVLGLIIFLSIHHSDAVSTAAVGTIGLAWFAFLCVLCVFVVILIIFWVIFPWMVYSLLKRILAELQKQNAK